jgi:Domain of unknown function (DUF4114)
MTLPESSNLTQNSSFSSNSDPEPFNLSVLVHPSLYRNIFGSDWDDEVDEVVQGYSRDLLEKLNDCDLIILRESWEACLTRENIKDPEEREHWTADLLDQWSADVRLVSGELLTEFHIDGSTDDEGHAQFALRNECSIATIDDPEVFKRRGIYVHTHEEMNELAKELDRFFQSSTESVPTTVLPTANQSPSFSPLRPHHPLLLPWVVFILLLLSCLHRPDPDADDDTMMSSGPASPKSPQPSGSSGSTIEPNGADRELPSTPADAPIAEQNQNLWNLILSLLLQIGSEASGMVTQVLYAGPHFSGNSSIATTPNILNSQTETSSGSLTPLDERSNFGLPQNLAQQVLPPGKAVDLLTQQIAIHQSPVFTLDVATLPVRLPQMSQQSVEQFVGVSVNLGEGLFNRIRMEQFSPIGLEVPSSITASITANPTVVSPVTDPKDPVIQSPPNDSPDPGLSPTPTPTPTPNPNPSNDSPDPVRDPELDDKRPSIWSNFYSGVYTVDAPGRIYTDYLWDGGAYEGEVGIFNLSGLETLLNNPTEFTQEVIRRVLSNSNFGYVVLSDATEGAKYSGQLVAEPDNYNAGTYAGVKSFEMTAGSQFGVVMIAQGQFKNVGKLTDTDGFFFSLTQNSRQGFLLNSQMVTKSQDRSILGMEDISVQNNNSDRDHNDLIVQVTGANGLTRSNSIQLQDLFTPNQFLTVNPLEPKPKS